MQSANEYTDRVLNAARMMGDPAQIFGGEKWRTLAHDYGYGLADCEDGVSFIQCSYSALCVRLFNLKPPVDAKEWMQAVRVGMERASRAR